MDEQKQDDQLKSTYSSSVSIQDVAMKISRKQWTIEKGGGSWSGRSTLVAWHDDIQFQFWYILMVLNTSRNYINEYMYIFNYKHHERNSSIEWCDHSIRAACDIRSIFKRKKLFSLNFSFSSIGCLTKPKKRLSLAFCLIITFGRTDWFISFPKGISVKWT